MIRSNGVVVDHVNDPLKVHHVNDPYPPNQRGLSTTVRG